MRAVLARVAFFPENRETIAILGKQCILSQKLGNNWRVRRPKSRQSSHVLSKIHLLFNIFREPAGQTVHSFPKTGKQCILSRKSGNNCHSRETIAILGKQCDRQARAPHARTDRFRTFHKYAGSRFKIHKNLYRYRNSDHCITESLRAVAAVGSFSTLFEPDNRSIPCCCYCWCWWNHDSDVKRTSCHCLSAYENFCYSSFHGDD